MNSSTSTDSSQPAPASQPPATAASQTPVPLTQLSQPLAVGPPSSLPDYAPRAQPPTGRDPDAKDEKDEKASQSMLPLCTDGSDLETRRARLTSTWPRPSEAALAALSQAQQSALTDGSSPGVDFWCDRSEFTNAQLKLLLRAYNLDESGAKQALAKRLFHHGFNRLGIVPNCIPRYWPDNIAAAAPAARRVTIDAYALGTTVNVERLPGAATGGSSRPATPTPRPSTPTPTTPVSIRPAAAAAAAAATTVVEDDSDDEARPVRPPKRRRTDSDPQAGARDELARRIAQLEAQAAARADQKQQAAAFFATLTPNRSPPQSPPTVVRLPETTATAHPNGRTPWASYSDAAKLAVVTVAQRTGQIPSNIDDEGVVAVAAAIARQQVSTTTQSIAGATLPQSATRTFPGTWPVPGAEEVPLSAALQLVSPTGTGAAADLRDFLPPTLADTITPGSSNTLTARQLDDGSVGLDFVTTATRSTRPPITTFTHWCAAFRRVIRVLTAVNPPLGARYMAVATAHFDHVSTIAYRHGEATALTYDAAQRQTYRQWHDNMALFDVNRLNEICVNQTRALFAQTQLSVSSNPTIARPSPQRSRPFGRGTKRPADTVASTTQPPAAGAGAGSSTDVRPRRCRRFNYNITNPPCPTPCTEGAHECFRCGDKGHGIGLCPQPKQRRPR